MEEEDTQVLGQGAVDMAVILDSGLAPGTTTPRTRMSLHRCRRARTLHTSRRELSHHSSNGNSSSRRRRALDMAVTVVMVNTKISISPITASTVGIIITIITRLRLHHHHNIRLHKTITPMATRLKDRRQGRSNNMSTRATGMLPPCLKRRSTLELAPRPSITTSTQTAAESGKRYWWESTTSGRRTNCAAASTT